MRDVYIVDGARTPFLKAKGKLGAFSASDLAVNVGKKLLGRQPFSPKDLDEVVIGCVIPSPDETNIGRVIALRLGCGKSVPAWTVQRNCASGMQALDSAAKDIASGRHHLVLAGGTEAMSRAPFMFSDQMTNLCMGFLSAKNWQMKVKELLRFRPSYLMPVIALIRGLSDPLVNLSMGQTAENLAYRFNITRAQMDQFALESHEYAIQGQDANHVDEISPLFSHSGDLYTASDGAALLLLASQEAIQQYQLPILARIVDIEWAGVDPAEMGLGPVNATSELLRRQNLQMDNIHYWEINEAFAAQVLACLAAW